MARRVFVLGGDSTPYIGKGHPAFVKGKHGIEDYVKSAVGGALRSTGVAGDAVDRICVGNGFGQLFCSQGHLGAAAAGADPGLRGKPSARFEAACASGGVAFEGGVQAIKAGADVVLVLGVEVQTTLSSRGGADALATAADYTRQRELDQFLWPAMFAKKAQAYFEKYPQVNDLPLVAEKAFDNARRNPLAHMHHSKLRLADLAKAKTFLANGTLKPHVTLADCSQMSDGASAVILVSEAGLAKLGKSEGACIEVLHVAQTTDSLFEDRDPTRLANMAAAAQQAYKATGLRPGDMDVAEVHDCFTMAEVLMCEALGFAPPGRGLDLVRSRSTRIEGRIPVNTGGGLVGFGHPTGATGVKQIVELHRQMKGQCGAYQVQKRLTHGIAANMGGDDKTAVVTLCRNTSPQHPAAHL